MQYGAHLGVAGGAHKALERARAIGATSVQIFTQSPRMWRHPDVDPDAAARFRAARKPARVTYVACHATYLINLGASDPELYEKSVGALRQHDGRRRGDRGRRRRLPPRQPPRPRPRRRAAAGDRGDGRRAGRRRSRVGDAARDRELRRRRRHDGRRPGRDRAGRRRARPARRGSACASTPATCGRRASTSPTRGGWTTLMAEVDERFGLRAARLPARERRRRRPRLQPRPPRRGRQGRDRQGARGDARPSRGAGAGGDHGDPGGRRGGAVHARDEGAAPAITGPA